MIPIDQRRGEFGTALKGAREARNISQSKLAERADFDHSYVSRLESGARVPTRDAVMRLAAAMGLLDPARDRLLATAGFLARNGQQAVIDAEPALLAAINLMGDGAVPAHLRDTFREQLFSLTMVYRLAAAVEVNQ